MTELTKEFVEKMKEKFGKVFQVRIAGEVYMYRLIKRSEFRTLQKGVVPQMTPEGPTMQQEQALDIEDKVSELCTLWPENFKAADAPAGAASLLAGYVSNSSGFIPESEPQEL